jgi:hypothetical protein
MNRIVLGILVFLIALCLPLGAQEQTQSHRCLPYPGVGDYSAWFRSTGLPAGHSYRVSGEKKDALRSAYAKLKLAISRSEAQRLLGVPDFEELVPEAKMRVPTGACEYQWAYILSKEKENLVDPHDVAIYLTFSTADRLTWAFPQNLDLKAKGSPTANVAPGVEPLGPPLDQSLLEFVLHLGGLLPAGRWLGVVRHESRSGDGGFQIMRPSRLKLDSLDDIGNRNLAPVLECRLSPQYVGFTQLGE